MIRTGQRVRMRINGHEEFVEVESRDLLLDVLRDNVGLTGPKKGCDESVCGCCAVLLNGRAICSCSMLALEAEGCEITTIEGFAHGHDIKELDPIQVAFIEHDAMQCGFCTSGQIIASKSLVEDLKRERLLEFDAEIVDRRIKEGLSGNLCRCGCYNNIVAAVKDVISNTLLE